MTEQSAAQIEARRTIMRTLFGTMVTQAVGVAARWELADAIGDGEAAAADLARVYDIPEERLNRLLRVLACLGLCVERTPGRYALTEAGYLLRKDNPNSLLDLTRLLTHQTMQEAWLHLETSMRTGRPAFDDVFGTPVFTYLGERPELSALFNSAMSQRTKGDGVAATLPQRYDFGRFSRVTDVGGGDGTLLTTILKHHPSLRGVVFDTPEGVAQASKTVEAAELTDRCEIAAGDFFEAVPGGSDLLLIKSVLHNWDDERSTTILRHCRAAMPDDGRLLIIEPVLPDTVDPGGAAFEDPYLSDLNMMVLIGGRERTRGDFERICAGAGLAVTDLIELPAHVDFAVVEAKPV